MSVLKTTLRRALPALLLLSTIQATLAHPTTTRGPVERQPVRREIKAYVQQNVLPVVRQQRQKLEQQLTTADKAQLAIYRTQLREVRQRGQALRKNFRTQAGSSSPATEQDRPRPALTEAQQQQVQQLRSETRGIMLNVGQLAQKYESNIAQLTQELRPQKQKWDADLQAILVKNATPGQQTGRTRGGRWHRAGAARLLGPAAFLLLNPNAPAAAESKLGSSLYPNPVVAATQLNYSVAKAGPVMVELLDSRGTTLRTVAQEAQQDKGSHTLQVNLSDLPTGTYYYKITTRGGSQTQRFVKE